MGLCILIRSFKETLLSGRSEVIFDPKVSHFATVPTILYPPKVSSEHLVDDCGTGLNHHRSDPKPILLAKNAFIYHTPPIYHHSPTALYKGFLSDGWQYGSKFAKIIFFISNKRHLSCNKPCLFSNTPALFSNTPALLQELRIYAWGIPPHPISSF